MSEVEAEYGLRHVPLELSPVPWTPEAARFVADGRSRIPSVHCFDFVPSDYEVAWYAMSHRKPGRFCEWGSGLGIAVGLAELLGYEASGIELDRDLADASRRLLQDHGLRASITTGSYLELNVEADYYYVYGWPGQLHRLLERFATTTARHAQLWICYGQSDLRCLAHEEAT